MIPTHRSTENPEPAAGPDLIEGAALVGGPLLAVVEHLPEDSSTENPPAGDGAEVVDDEAATELGVQSVQQGLGLHANDVAPLEEKQVG